MASKVVMAIVGMQKGKQNNLGNIFKVVLCNIKDNGRGQLDWTFAFKLMSESDTCVMIRKCGGALNAKVDESGTKVVSNGPSFDRFNKGAIYVILSEIEADGKIVGYKVATSGGKVHSIKAKAFYGYCYALTKDGKVPIQNAIYVSASGGKSEFIRAYEGLTFIHEVMNVQKNAYTKTAPKEATNNRVNMDNRARLQQTFTPEQIAELQEGRKNGVNIKIYANPKLSAEQMAVARRTLEDGKDPSKFTSPDFSPDSMETYRIAMKYGSDISQIINPNYEPERIVMLSEAYAAGLSIGDAGNPDIPLDELSEIINRLDAGIWKEYKVSTD